MNKNLFLIFFLSLSFSCGLVNLNPSKESGEKKKMINFFGALFYKSQGTSSAKPVWETTSSSAFYVNAEDIKKIDNVDPLVHKNKLPSQISLNLSLQTEKSRKLKDIKVSLKEGSIEKDDETGIYKYKVSLKKGSKKDELVVTYYFQSKRTYYTSILSSITESDIGNIDNINGDIFKITN